MNSNLPTILPMVNLTAILLILFNLLITIRSNDIISLETVNNRLCQNLCQCMQETIDCNHQDNLPYLPTKIDKIKYNKFHITKATFINRGLTQQNFTSLSNLVSLKIIYSHLQSIDANTFSYMLHLRYLDLSSNNFINIHPKAFTGLSLTTFFLERNIPSLIINKKSFQDLKVGTLSLVSNGIKEIPFEPFADMGIVKLRLFNNSISQIDKRFEYLFNRDISLFDLTENPLYCGCGFQWFSNMMKVWTIYNKNVNIRCHNPIYLRDRLINTLRDSDFTCEIPNISKITIFVNQQNIQLICHTDLTKTEVSSSSINNWNNPLPNNLNIKPRLTWKQIDKKTGNEISHYENLRQSQKGTSVALNVTKIQPESSFICTASNEINMSNQVIVNLTLAQDYLKSLQKSSSPSSINNNDKASSTINPSITFNHNKNHGFNSDNIGTTQFLFRKQFSILQMIGAVVGTFTCVVILIIIIYCCQERMMRKRACHTMSGGGLASGSMAATNSRFSMLGAALHNAPPYSSYATGGNHNEYHNYYPNSQIISTNNYKPINNNNHLTKSPVTLNGTNGPNYNQSILSSGMAIPSNMIGSTHSQDYEDPNQIFNSSNNSPPSSLIKSTQLDSHLINVPHPTTKSTSSSSSASTAASSSASSSTTTQQQQQQPLTSSSSANLINNILPQPPNQPQPPLPSSTNLIPIIQSTPLTVTSSSSVKPLYYAPPTTSQPYFDMINPLPAYMHSHPINATSHLA